MRVRDKKNGVSVHAIAGDHVVCLGLNATKKAAKGLLGLAICRRDHSNGKSEWLRAARRFEQAKIEQAPAAFTGNDGAEPEIWALIEL